MNSQQTIIQVNKVTKTFKDLTAVNDLSIEISKGEYVALLGPNGAGKTTLVEMIEGIQFPTKGEILIKGKPWKGNETEHRKILGLSFQETQFMDKVTVEETLNLFGSFYGLDENRTKEILELTNLEEKKNAYVSNLSGGQRQRLALGVALLNQPEILLLDEPTTGLDPKARRDIWDILSHLRGNGTTLILTTHYMEEAEYLCDRILIMFKGKIIAKGTLNELLDIHAKGEIIEFRLEKPTSDLHLDDLTGVQSFSWDENANRGHLVVNRIMEVLPSFLKHIEKMNLSLLDLQSRKSTLDDLFISMTGQRLDD